MSYVVHFPVGDLFLVQMPSDRVSQKCPVSIPFYEVKVESRKGNIFKFTSAISDECIDIYRDIMHDD